MESLLPIRKFDISDRHLTEPNALMKFLLKTNVVHATNKKESKMLKCIIHFIHGNSILL